MYLDEMNDNDWVFYAEDALNPIAVDTTTKIEGVSSLKLYVEGTSERPQIRIQDTALSADFPYKTDRTNNEFTICFWMKHYGEWTPLEFQSDYYATWEITKYHDSVNHFGITAAFFDAEGNTILKGTIRFEFHTDEGGGTPEFYDFGSGADFDINKWYHVAVTYTPGEYRIRIFDNDAEAQLAADKTGVCGTIKTNDGFIMMYEGKIYGTNSTTWIDEMVVFNRVLTVEEIDAVRAGTYGT